jgi:hypothetical protein
MTDSTLLGLSTGFDTAELVSLDIPAAQPTTASSNQPIMAGMRHLDATAIEEITLAGPGLTGSLEQARAAAESTSGYQAWKANGHENDYVASGYVDPFPGGLEQWYVQFATVTGNRSYETESDWHDSRLIIANSAVPAVVVEEGKLGGGTVANYPIEYFGIHGVTTLNHALENGYYEYGADFRLALVTILDPFEYGGVEEASLYIVSQNGQDYLWFSAVNGQLIEKVSY